jgi:hypothetical protein
MIMKRMDFSPSRGKKGACFTVTTSRMVENRQAGRQFSEPLNA